LGNLQTPLSVQKLQTALHAKAKAKEEPEFRFYALYDKLYRGDVLRHAYACCHAKQSASATHPLPGRELRALRQLRREVSGPFQGYLGPMNIRHIVCYTELASTRFKGLFD
jgi:hypothetical protein